jgi:hypothetical protein
MPQDSTGSPNPFEITQHAKPQDTSAGAARRRRIALPLRMDDGQIRTFDLPSALERPSQFSAAEFERLTRAYAEALGLLGAATKTENSKLKSQT